ncbi:MAG: hypothetical protein R3A48_23055 [Polyangiales bacterium]
MRPPSLVATLVMVLGCATAPVTPRAPVAEPACVGTIAAAPEGARRVEDPTLLASALGAEGEGRLCTGAVFEATRAVTVYRVWQRDRAHTELGRWWSLERPVGPRASYRAQNDICPEWSALDAWSRCELRVGARFVLGPGQSARCAGGSVLPRSAVNQVYIDNDTRQGRLFVERCEQLGAWPEPTP